MAINEEHLEDDEIIVLEDEDGNEHRFVLAEILTVDERDYAVLLPIDEDVEDGVIFRVENGENDDEMVLSEIESDEEFERVAAIFNAEDDDPLNIVE